MGLLKYVFCIICNLVTLVAFKKTVSVVIRENEKITFSPLLESSWNSTNQPYLKYSSILGGFTLQNADVVESDKQVRAFLKSA